MAVREADVRLAVTVDELPVRKSGIRRFMKAFFSRPAVVVCVAVLSAALLTAIFAPLLAPYDPNEQNLVESLRQPSGDHWLGTDMLGRDVLSRVIYGTRISLAVGFVVVFIAGVLGMSLGLLSGYLGGWVDTVLMRVMDAMIAVPMIVLAMALGAALGGGIVNVILSLGIAIVPTYARLMRGQVLAVKHADYVVAGTLIGASALRNMLVHVFPNCISPLIVLMTMNLGTAILAEAGLSFLGLGIDPPDPSWGSMVNDGYRYLLSNPLISLAPGFAIMAVVLSCNILGDALRDALDPRLRH